MTQAPVADSSPARPRRGCLWALALLVLAAAGGVAAVILWPHTPTVSAMVRIDTGRAPFGLEKAPTEQDLAANRNHHVALVRNRLVLASALKDPKVAKLPFAAQPEEALEWLEANVVADFSLAPEVLRISLSGHDTTSLVVIVDAITAAYLREIVDKERFRQQETQKALTRMITEYEDRLKAAREAQKGMDAMLNGRKTGMIPILLEAAKDDLKEYQRELRKLRLAKLAAEARIMAASKADKVEKGRGEKETAVLEAHVRLLTKEIELMVERIQELGHRGMKGERNSEDNSAAIKMLDHLRSEKEKLDIKLRAPSRVEHIQSASVGPAPDRLAFLKKLLSPGP